MAVVLALPLYAVLCLALWADPRWQPDWDGALTILTARNLAEGQGYSYLGRPFILRPPGLAWFLSHLQGVGRFDAAPFNLAIMGFAGAWVAAIYFALRAETSRARALAIALLTGTSALAVERFNRIESEFPFAAALFLAFGLHERAQRRASTALAALAGLALATSLYLRSAGLVILLPHGLDGGDPSRTVRFLATGDGHRRAGSGQLDGDRSAEAGPTTGHHGDFSRERVRSDHGRAEGRWFG